jgi:hypothetical protein
LLFAQASLGKSRDPSILHFLPWLGWQTAATTPSFFFHWHGGGFHKLFCWGRPQTRILLISVSQIARITGASHWHPC